MLTIQKRNGNVYTPPAVPIGSSEYCTQSTVYFVSHGLSN